MVSTKANQCRARIDALHWAVYKVRCILLCSLGCISPTLHMTHYGITVEAVFQISALIRQTFVSRRMPEYLVEIQT